MKRPRALAPLVAAALALLLAATPTPAFAKVTVTVEFAYASATACGLVLVIYVVESWEIPLAVRELPTALLEVRGTSPRLGIPLPSLSSGEFDAGPGPHDAVRFDLLRWRF